MSEDFALPAPKNNNAELLNKLNIKKRRQEAFSQIPVINLDFETALNISIALESGESDAFIFPFFDATGATFVENRSDGSSMLGWLGEEGTAVMGFTIPTRSDALFFAKGFSTASEEVVSSPNHEAVAKIRTDVATFVVSDVIPVDDPRRASEEAMTNFINRIQLTDGSVIKDNKE